MRTSPVLYVAMLCAATVSGLSSTQRPPIAKVHSAPKPLSRSAKWADWPQFLGPSLNASTPESPLLASFGKIPPKIVWEISKGEGYATATVIKGRVLLFHREENHEALDCLDAVTGKRVWRFAYTTSYRDDWGFNGGPRAQPVCDGRTVFTLGAGGRLQAVEFTSGKPIWQHDLATEFKQEKNFFGFGAAPLIEGDLVIVQAGGQPGPVVAAFHKETGKFAWGAGKDWSAGYASPISATIMGKRRVFVFTGGKSEPPDGGLLVVDPANGKVEFQLPWRSRRQLSVNASAPLVIGNRVLISECYGMGGVMLEARSNGSWIEVWRNRDFGTHFMTAVHKDGYLYGIDGHGPQNAPLVCVDARTGKEMWRKEPDWSDDLKTPAGTRKLRLGPGLASLLVAGGRTLLVSEYGHLAWVDLNPKGYKELSRTLLYAAPESWGVPALSKGLLYLCQNSDGIDGSKPRLLCIDLRGNGWPAPGNVNSGNR